MVWPFKRRLAGKLSNPNNEAAFQAELYRNIDSETNKTIIAVTHIPNRAMHKIITLVNSLTIHFY